MSEADMDNNPSFLNPNQPAAQNSSSPSDEPAEVKENSALTGKQSPELERDEWKTVNFPNAITIEQLEAGTPASDPEEPGKETKPPQAFSTSAGGNNAGISQITELIALIQQVRQRNNELTHRVATLENTLHECQIALELTQSRNQTQEALLKERTEELEAAQSKNERLTQELEATSQNAQRQQILIQTFSEQLESSQQRLAQMERECALTQQRYSEKTQQLMQVENTCRDLRTRLHRQQRHTLQFKAALEKCLEMPDSIKEKKLDVIEKAGVPTSLSENSVIEGTQGETTSLTPKTDPIKPWVAPTMPTATETTLKNAAEIDTNSSTAIPNTPTPASSTGDALLWDNITRLIDETPTPKPAEPAPPPNQPNSDSVTSTPNPFPAPLVSPQQIVKKRHSLAAIDLPSFPRLQDGVK